MSTTLTLPPSHRDFEVYQRVVIEGASTRQAAGEFSRSQTRIRQIVLRVTQWLTANLPPQDEATDAAYLRHAQHVAADRLSYFYSLAMDGWRAEGQVKYFNMAIRVALAQSKLAVIPGTIECLAADAIEGPLPEEVGCAVPASVLSREQTCSRSAEPAASTSNTDVAHAAAPLTSAGPGLVPAKNSASEPPPPRDCSPESAPPTSGLRPLTSTPAPSSSAATSSAHLQPAAAAARRAFLAPAHSAPPTGDLSVTELKITPQELGLASQRKLSRRERRKLLRAKARA